MRKILIAGWLIGCTAACVNLDKPEKVAECAAAGQCVNSTVTDGGSIVVDGGKDGSLDKPDVRLGADGDGPAALGTETRQPTLDGSQVTDDTPPVGLKLDGGNLFDVPVSDTPEQPIVDGSPLDTPVISLDGAVDKPGEIDGSIGTCSVAGQPAPAGTVCRKSTDLCDLPESCDGVSLDCPPDKLTTAGAPCRPAAGKCDVAETCDGTTAACPADGFVQAGTVCREAADLCDVAESCTGTSADCPIDSLQPANTTCRPSTDGNKCDPAETCTGSSPTCPPDALYAPPAQPTGVGATGGTLSATILWTEAANATGYFVKQSLTGNPGSYTKLGTSSPTVPLGTTTTYADTGLTGGTTYYYVVSSINMISTCESIDSTPAASATPSGTCTAPAQPTSVTATPGNGQIVLSWSGTAASYSIFRRTASETSYSPLQTDVTTTTYTDASAQYGNTYYYVVTAFNGTCSSIPSAEISASPACAPAADPPGNLKATPSSTGSVIVLTWTGTASIDAGASGYYQVLRNTDGSTSYPWNKTTSTTTYTDTNLTNGTTYYYVVTYYNGTCTSVSSTQVSAIPACIPPSPPTTLNATPSDKKVQLSWTAMAGAASYELSRKVGTANDSTYVVLTPAGYTGTSWTDNDPILQNGTSYTYRVSASNGSCSSSTYTTKTGVVPNCTNPSPPTALQAAANDGSVTLSWTASTTTGSTYTVLRGATSGSETSIATAITGTTYTNSGLTNNNTYYYVVVSNFSTCSSINSNEVSAKPTPACGATAPATITGTATGSKQVTLTWGAVAGATSYGIARSEGSCAGFTSITSVTGSPPATTWIDTDPTLKDGTAYCYQVSTNGTTCASVTSSVTPRCASPAAPSTNLKAVADTDISGNPTGSITVSWQPVGTAQSYTVSRSTTSNGTYSTLTACSNQTTASCNDTTGSNNGDTYYYEVTATNSGTCISLASSPVSAMSCVKPDRPADSQVVARRAGHHRVTVSWAVVTTSTVVRYDVWRSTSATGTYTNQTSPNGVTPPNGATTMSYQDETASNGTVYYYYVVASKNSAGTCNSGNTAWQKSALSCSTFTCSGSPGNCGYSATLNTTNGLCLVTCDTIASGNWNSGNWGNSQLYLNNVSTVSGGTIPTYANNGLAWEFTSGGGTSTYITTWNGTAYSCP